jgi:phosphoglycerate kinase
MSSEFNTIDDFDVENKTVLVRVDINAPVDPSDGIILDDTRLKLHSETIKELSKKGAKVVLLAHQSRPGKKDFTTLSQHAEALSDLLNLRVKYVDSLFSNSAKEAIKDLKPHEILLLENVRFFSEESLSRTPEEQSKTLLVRHLSPLIDYFVNDAFAAAHRSQASQRQCRCWGWEDRYHKPCTRFCPHPYCRFYKWSPRPFSQAYEDPFHSHKGWAESY